MSQLTPDLAEIEALRDTVEPGPIVMLNLLKFKPGGRAHFAEYGAVAAPLVQKAGGEIVYAGEAGPMIVDGPAWDLVILVRFPDIERFIEMVSHPDYQTQARAHREAALERTLWMATKPSS